MLAIHVNHISMDVVTTSFFVSSMDLFSVPRSLASSKMIAWGGVLPQQNWRDSHIIISSPTSNKKHKTTLNACASLQMIGVIQLQRNFKGKALKVIFKVDFYWTSKHFDMDKKPLQLAHHGIIRNLLTTLSFSYATLSAIYLAKCFAAKD